MKDRGRVENERGIALVVTLFVALVVATISAGAALMSSSASLVQRYSDQQSLLTTAADAALEEARSKVNGTPGLYPDSGFAVLENGVAVYDADGQRVPGLKRWLYVGPSGVTTGQYGVFGSIVTVVEDHMRNVVIRRGEIAQESFAKYAYFTDVEPSYISFGGGDQIQGPVHTNDYLKIFSSGATFMGSVTTAKTVQGAGYGRFKQGFHERHHRIEMPQMTDLTKLEVQAATGGTSFVTSDDGNDGTATTRIEFVAIDLNGDGQVNGDNEGFIKVYQGPDHLYVSGDTPADYNAKHLQNSTTCGHYHGATFVAAADHPNAEPDPDSWLDAVTDVSRRCYLGGADELFGQFEADGGSGQWLQWTGVVDPIVAAARPLDAQYLIPITRQFNPSFRGVIYVDGKVAISGVVRGRVTVAATEDIIIVDDVTYATNPGAGICADILGLFAGDDIVLSDNAINAPIRPDNGLEYRTYDDTSDEFVHGVALALDVFSVENYAAGSNVDEPCEAISWGRGCLYLTGGVIQRTRGPVGLTSGRGNLKRYSYDQCAYTDPPPYFPTTGHFNRGRYYEVDPVGFDVHSYWSMLTPQP